ncbi:MAG: GNAT family N-acetyltransferase [Methanoregula sp.]|jgi:ribosomal protein S18 acetylase RimI-like enzyme|nr:GNAT family N-acetyltransferase [Methanoregula sp.]
MRLEPDSWLSKIFSYPVFRVIDIEQDPSMPADDLIRRSHISQIFYYAKVPVGRLDLVHALNDAGFKVVDVNVTFECTPRETKIDQTSPIIIHVARPEDRDATLNLAETCFLYSRFHLDPEISNDLANLIKREWVANYFKGERGEQILVAERNAKPIGFLAITKGISGNKSIRAIDLIGIQSEYQRIGAGSRLVNFFINDSVTKCDILRVGTQIANVPSMNFYQRCGFYITESAYVLHAHVLDGKVI